MKSSRRRILQGMTLLGMSSTLSGCEHVASELTMRMGQSIPEKIPPIKGTNIDPIFHLLSRAGYGPRPGDLAQAQAMGAKEWLSQQLFPEKIDDGACEIRARRFETLHLDPGTAYEYKKPVLRDELIRHSVIRATYSKRQLFEAMVEFWSDHFNIYIEKGDCMYLKGADDRLVIRKNALGNFRDLVRASATSPAMLVYLDGNENKKSGSGGIPNENYARELLELHTLGVHGGYTQNDVYEVGRCFTGWRLHTPWQRAVVFFDETTHDDGEKHVLGHSIPAGGGAKDIDRVIDIVCAHPSTAHHIATKMVRRFVADDPPPNLVQAVAERFSSGNGQIKPLLETIFASNEFASSAGSKFKRPFRYLVSCLRFLGSDTYAHAPVLAYLTRMGQEPFEHPTPDGYSDLGNHWETTMLWRWNLALSLAANKIEGVKSPLPELFSAVTGKHDAAPNRSDDVEMLAPYFIGRQATKTETDILSECAQSITDNQSALSATIGLILASPAFQRY